MPNKILEIEKRIAICDDDFERLNLLLELADLNENEDYAEGWKIAAEALDLAKRLESKLGMAKAQEEMGNCLWKLGEFGDAQTNYENALDDYLILGDLHGVARCYCGMGIIAGTIENYRAALEYFEDGLSAANRTNQQKLSATLIGNIGHVYFNLGNYEQAMRCFEHGYRYYAEAKDEHGAGNMLGGMAGIHVYQGELEKGMEVQRRALLRHKQAKHARGIATGLMNVGIVFQRMGQMEKARKELVSALNYSRSIHLKTIEMSTLKLLSEVCAELGDEEASDRYMKNYLEVDKDKKQQEVEERKKQSRMQQQVRLIQNGN